jgi:hypothetical protein
MYAQDGEIQESGVSKTYHSVKFCAYIYLMFNFTL